MKISPTIINNKSEMTEEQNEFQPELIGIKSAKYIGDFVIRIYFNVSPRPTHIPHHRLLSGVCF
jgi:hypothetical protein